MNLGQRIAIIGPSSSGKSTLSQNLGLKLDFPVLHLDQIAHRTGTAWERLPDAEFVMLQRHFLSTHTRWIIEGNYSVGMPDRFKEAQTLIWCDPPLLGCVTRYALRCWRNDRRRPGILEAAPDAFNPWLVKYTLWNYPQNRKKYKEIIENYPHLQILHLTTFHDIKSLAQIVTAD